MPSPGVIAALSTPAAGTRSSWAWVSKSDGGTRLSFPSTDPGREVFQPNAVVGFRHGQASLPARRLRRPCPAERWFSRAPPPCSSRPSLPFSRQCGAHIAFMAYLSSLTGMRRLAVAPSEWLGGAFASAPRERAATPLACGAEAVANHFWVFPRFFNANRHAEDRRTASGWSACTTPKAMRPGTGDGARRRARCSSIRFSGG
jgi:hypothetical protein